jgi:subtilisin family serine protease
MKSIENYLGFLNFCIQNKVKILREFDEFDLIIVEVPINENINDFKDKVDSLSFVETSELDLLFETEYTYEFTYDHPYHWYLQNIKSMEAWDLMNQFPDNEPVEVAMIDTLVDISHPELIGKISDSSINVLSFYSSDIGPDDYYVDFGILAECGLDACNTGCSNIYHGTGCAGLLAARNSNNDMMLSASNDKVKIQVLTESYMTCYNNILIPNYNSSWAFIEQLFAAFNNIKCVVITLQKTFPPPNIIMNYLIDYVAENGRSGRGIPIFASSGNQSLSTLNQFCSEPNVFCVGASNALDNRAGFSNYGDGLFICAPGENIMTLSVRGIWGASLPSPNFGTVKPRNKKDYVNTARNLLITNGTSSSTPIVAAVAATMIYVNPRLTKTQVISILSETARKTSGTEGYVFDGNGYNIELGYGIIDHEAAIQAAIDARPSNWELGDEEIGITITQSQESANEVEWFQIETMTQINPLILSSVEYLVIKISISWDGIFTPQDPILFEQTYDGSQLTEFNENSHWIQVPNLPDTVNSSTLRAQSSIFDANFVEITNGFVYDEIPLTISHISPIDDQSPDIQIEFLEVVPSTPYFQTTQPLGYAMKIKLTNTGDMPLLRAVLSLSVNNEDYSTTYQFFETFQHPIDLSTTFYLEQSESQIFYWSFGVDPTPIINSLPSNITINVDTIFFTWFEGEGARTFQNGERTTTLYVTDWP